MTEDFIGWSIVILLRGFDLVLLDPVHHRHMAYAQYSFDFPIRDSFDIKLQGLHYIIRINAFPDFIHRKVIITFFAFESLSTAYNSTFYYFRMITFGAKGLFHISLSR
jgi:hypothetical protein